MNKLKCIDLKFHQYIIIYQILGGPLLEKSGKTTLLAVIKGFSILLV